MNNSKKACLFIFFNNRFDENIPKLEKMYRKRFPDLDYLVPFVNDYPHIFAVHGSNNYSQGYFAEVYPRICKRPFSHFIFCADDLILHPNLNAENILSCLNLDEGAAYFKSFTPLVEGFNNGWIHTLNGFTAVFNAMDNGVLPSPQTAAQLVARHGLPWLPITIEHLSQNYQTTREMDSTSERLAQQIAVYGPYFAHPLMYGYSDFLVVPGESLNLFCYYCGMFASIGLFEEIAIPTALLFSCDKVVTEDKTVWRGTELWDSQLIEGLKNQFQGNMNGLLESFQSNQLYIHPVKISQWDI